MQAKTYTYTTHTREDSTWYAAECPHSEGPVSHLVHGLVIYQTAGQAQTHRAEGEGRSCCSTGAVADSQSLVAPELLHPRSPLTSTISVLFAFVFEFNTSHVRSKDSSESSRKDRYWNSCNLKAMCCDSEGTEYIYGFF